MRICGLIHMIELDNRIIGLKCYKHIKFFYFQNSQMNTFKRYLYQDNWIELEYEEEPIKKGKFLAYKVESIYNLKAISKLNVITYYDKFEINRSLYDFLYNFDNLMFLDLEMTMPPFNFKGKGFKTEMIQAGYEIYNKNMDLVLKYSNYVKPKINKEISSRTEKFLGITIDEFNKTSIPYNDFYKEFNKSLDKYNPAIVVYGKNDQIVLNESYDINKKPSLSNKTRYVNLCQIIKTFYGLKNDPGLFKLFSIYYDNQDTQEHDALVDSEVLRKVFLAFRKDVLEEEFKKIIKKELS